MGLTKFATVVLVTLVGSILCSAQEQNQENEVITDKKIVKAVVESCSGCQLNRLPEVRSFIYDDLPLYPHAEFDRKPGAPPFLYLLNQSGEKVETIDLRSLNREQCNQLLLQRGFYKKSSPNEEVPEEFASGPSTARIDL